MLHHCQKDYHPINVGLKAKCRIQKKKKKKNQKKKTGSKNYTLWNKYLIRDKLHLSIMKH